MVKFRRHMGASGQTLWGDVGNKGPQRWENIVRQISDRGVLAVEFVRHHDQNPKNFQRLKGWEMLKLWKDVSKPN